MHIHYPVHGTKGSIRLFPLHDGNRHSDHLQPLTFTLHRFDFEYTMYRMGGVCHGIFIISAQNIGGGFTARSLLGRCERCWYTCVHAFLSTATFVLVMIFPEIHTYTHLGVHDSPGF